MLGSLLAAQETLQARHGGGPTIGDFLYRHFSRGEAALIGLGISLLAGLLGVWVGKTPIGKLGKGVLYFSVAAVLLILLPLLIPFPSDQ